MLGELGYWLDMMVDEKSGVMEFSGGFVNFTVGKHVLFTFYS